MDTMEVIGELLIKDANAVYGPIARRVTDAAHFRYNLLQLGGTTTGGVAAVVEHRDTNEDTWTNAGSFLNATSTGRKNKSISGGLKEVVRLKLTFNSGSSDAWARVRIMSPVWTTAAVPAIQGIRDQASLPHPAIVLGKGGIGPVEVNADPPDPQIAVSSRHLLVVVNEEVALYSKQTLMREWTKPLSGPGGLLPEPVILDPRCFFDQYDGRFVIMALTPHRVGGTTVWLAVSRTSDPRKGWHLYGHSIASFTDYSGGGYNELFYTHGTGTRLYVWNKSRVLVGLPTVPKEFTGLRFFIQPTHSWGNTGGVQYALQRFRDAPSDLNIYAVTPTLQLRATVLNIDKNLPNNLPTCQTKTIQGSDGRMEQTAYRNGLLYGSYGVSSSDLGHDRYLVHVVEVNPNGWPLVSTQPTLRSTTVVADRQQIGISAATVNDDGQVGMIVETSSTNTPPGIAVLGRDSAGRRTPIVKVKGGACKTGKMVWGDYFGIAADQDGSFWAIGEYWLAPSLGDKWATWIQNFKVVP